MANALYDPGREGFLDGSIDWDTDDIRVMLVLSTYTFSAAHKFITDLGAVDNGRSAALGSKTVTNGVADAGDTSLTATAASASKALGLPVVSVPGAAWEIVASGIASGELFGLATVAPYVEPEFIGGGAVVPLRHLPAHRIGGAGRILSEEVFGRPLVAPGQRSRARRARDARELSGRWFS